jgi:hypothetical protein
MGNVLASVLVYVFILILSFYVAATWMRWFRNRTKPTESRWSRWRRAITVLGFAVTSVSLLLINTLAVHASITGGLPYYHPILLLAFRVGFLSALLGMLAAFVGTGQLENPTIAVSGLSLLIWFVEGIAQ